MRPRFLTAVVIALPLGLAPVVATAEPPRAGDPPATVTPVIDSVPFPAARGHTTANTAREIRHDKPFSMAAVRWTGRAPDVLEIKAKDTRGNWSEWYELEAVHEPDAGAPGARKASQPAWLGDSTAVRVRAERDGSPVPSAELSAVLIDPGSSSADGNQPTASTSTPMPQVITRAEWGADEEIRRSCFAEQGIGVEYSSTLKAVSVHHTAGTNSYSAADSARIVRGIYAYHGQTLGWCDIGYHALVDKYGQLFEGRYGGLNRPVWGAHAGGFNEYTAGVSMMGNYENVAPSAAQLESVSSFIAWKLAGSYRDPHGSTTLVSAGGGTSKYPRGTPVTLPRIMGHRDTGSTVCPGEIGYQRLPAIRQRVSELMGDWRSSPILARWNELGGDNGRLGGPFEVERDTTPPGRVTVFANGRISAFWSAETGTHLVQGAIRDRWDSLGGPSSELGFPITDQLATADNTGRYNRFQHGAVYWSPATGAHPVHGPIRQKWAELNREQGPLGFPTTGRRATPDGDGHYNHFEGGSIYRSDAAGTHAVLGAIRAKWGETGWERGPLGYPASGRYQTLVGPRQNFQFGYLLEDRITGQVTVHLFAPEQPAVE